MKHFDFTSVKALFLDLDGVLWNGKTPIGNTQVIFEKLKKADVFPILGTNNATRTPESYQKKMADLGVEIRTEQVISPAIGAAYLFKNRFPENITVHVFGSQALKNFLQEEGFVLSDEKADVVLVSLDQEMTYQKIAVAKRLIDAGAAFYATNLDNVLASENGWLPGGGVMVKAVETCTRKKPIVIGKPEPLLMQIAMEKFGLSTADIVAVGDRYDTDILGAMNAGCRNVMVLSGVDSVGSIAHYERQPDLICSDLNHFADLVLQNKLSK